MSDHYVSNPAVAPIERSIVELAKETMIQLCDPEGKELGKSEKERLREKVQQLRTLVVDAFPDIRIKIDELLLPYESIIS